MVVASLWTEGPHQLRLRLLFYFSVASTTLSVPIPPITSKFAQMKTVMIILEVAQRLYIWVTVKNLIKSS